MKQFLVPTCRCCSEVKNSVQSAYAYLCSLPRSRACCPPTLESGFEGSGRGLLLRASSRQLVRALPRSSPTFGGKDPHYTYCVHFPAGRPTETASLAVKITATACRLERFGSHYVVGNRSKNKRAFRPKYVVCSLNEMTWL